MKYRLVMLEDFFKSWQIEYINLLNDCGLLGKFTPDCKKLLIYLFLVNFNKNIDDSGVLFYHSNQLSKDLEIFDYVDYDKFNIFFNKVVNKVRRLTGKIFIIKHKKTVPSEKFLSELDGSIQDEILLLQNIEFDSKEFKKFLGEVNLKNIFKDMSWKLV